MRTSTKLFSVLLASSIVAAPTLALASPVDTLGAGMFRDAAQKEAARREQIGKAQLASLRFQLVQQALIMQKSGIQITAETFPEHYAALHGPATASQPVTFQF